MSAFHSSPNPINDYATAVAKLASMQEKDTATPGFDPRLKSILLTHGQKTRRAVLWFHGYTAAPLEFGPLAQLCFEKGYNAFVPCAPHHGFKDQFSSEAGRVKRQELVLFMDAMVDLMHGLGDEIIVGGLSMGGVETAWVAQERPDVSVAIIVAPFLGARIIPDPLIRAVTGITQLLPDILIWDPDKKNTSDGADWGYYMRSFHSLGQIMLLGFQIFDFAAKRPPAARQVWMVINAHDDQISIPMARRLVDTWRNSGAENVQTFTFPDEWRLPHACIAVEDLHANTRLVYPELMRLVG